MNAAHTIIRAVNEALFPRWVCLLIALGWVVVVYYAENEAKEKDDAEPLGWLKRLLYIGAGTLAFILGGPVLIAAGRLTGLTGWAGNLIGILAEDHPWLSLIAESFGLPLLVIVLVTGILFCVPYGLGFFRDPEPPEPVPSGVYGSAEIESDTAVLASANLIGAQWGDGIRIGYDQAGNVMRYLGENSIIGIGAPGTGKFTDLIAPAMIEYGASIRHGGPGGSCVIVDQKGQISAVTIAERRKLGEVIVLCPFTEGLPEGLPELLGPTRSYNPMRALLDPNSQAFEITCDALAETIIPEKQSGEGSNANFFTAEAIGLVSGVMMMLMLKHPEEEQNLAKVCSVICGREIFGFARTAIKTGNPYIIERLAAFAEPLASDDKTIKSILKTADSGLRWLSNPSIGKIVSGQSDWRFSELKNRPITVLLILPDKFIDSCSQWFRIVTGSAMIELKATPKGRVPVLFLLDEFARLGKVPIFETAFADGRGYGIQLWPFVQRIGQLKNLYGKDGWQAFLSGAQIQIYLPPRDMETADHVSKETGRRTVVTVHYSYSGRNPQPNYSYGEQGQPVYDAQQIMNLGKNRCLIFARGMVDNVIEARRRFYLHDPEIKQRCGPDPYHQPFR